MISDKILQFASCLCIALTDICETVDLVVGERTYGISVIHYFTAAEAVGSKNLKPLTRALYAYSVAARGLQA